jgi:DNA-binding MarR family transcriptional regulator
MPTQVDQSLVASELRVVIGQLIRRLRSEHRLPLSHGVVLGRLDRDGSQSVSELALAERMRPQSMAQTVADLEADGYVARRPDPTDGRRALVDLTETGLAALESDRRQREGWLAGAIAHEMSAEEQAVLRDAVPLLRRLAES